MASEKKRRFFDEQGKDAAGVSYEEVLRRAPGSGFGIDPETGLVEVSSQGLYGRDYLGWRERRKEADVPGTTVNKLRQQQYRQLAWQLHDTGRIVTRSREGGGTDFFWSGGKDVHGRPMRHDLRIASSSVPGLAPESLYFKPGEPGFVASGLDYDLLAERYDRAYEVVFGERSVTGATPDEQRAADYKAKLEEAGRIAREARLRKGSGSTEATGGGNGGS